MIPFPFTYNGREYKNLSAFCRGEGLPYSRTAARLRAGRPLRDLFVKGHLGAVRTGIDLDGHPSIQAMAKAAGVSYGCMYGRLHSGRSAEESMMRKVPRRVTNSCASSVPKNANAVEYGGVVYPSLRRAAVAAGLPMDAVYQRWHRGVRGDDLFSPMRPRGCVRKTA